MKRQLHRCYAFSLLELLLVLSILALLFSMVVPAVRSWQLRTEIDLGKSKLLNAIHQARLMAVREGKRCAVRLETRPNRLVVEPVSHSVASVKVAPGKSLSEERSSGRLPESVRIQFFERSSNQPLKLLQIDPRGDPQPVVIRLYQHGNRVAQLEVDRLTGSLRASKQVQ